MAQLRGKLSSEVWLESEDLLTSAVFGTLKNLGPAIAVDLLSLAQPLAGSAPPMLTPPLDWQFWPRWETCEPDVVIEDERNLCVIEAKLYSEFGEDVGAGTQLRREWIDGIRRSQETGKELWLVTLTNHGSIPDEAIQRQLARGAANLSHVSWLSWLEIGRFVRGLKGERLTGWREDLLELLTRMGLAPFDGFGEAIKLAMSPSRGLPWAREVLLNGKLRGTVGFGPPIQAAIEWKEKGGVRWRLTQL